MTQKMKNTIFFTENLAIGYSSKKETISIAKNININLEKGKLIALIGANGIGKSTLLRTIAAIQKPLSGTIYLNDKNISTYNSQQLAQNISVVFTEKLPPSNLSVFELIALGRQPYTNWLGKLCADDLLKIEEALKVTQIEHLRHKKHFELSDGQLQQVLIARALAQDAPLIILDEPTTHLDLVNKVSLLKLLLKLTRSTNKCILFSSHDIDLAIQLSDQMIVFANDTIVQDEPCKLIENGIFESIFKNECIVFDKLKGTFKIT